MRILQLGAAFHQAFFIEELIKNGYVVESISKYPEDPGHVYSSKSYNISITDIDNIKRVHSNSDYILSSYGSDIAELTRLIITKDETPQIKLLKKDTARNFLKQVYPSQRQPNIRIAKRNEKLSTKWRVVKPNISSGSKGVAIIKENSPINEFIKIARDISVDNMAVIEEYINNDGRKYYCEGLIINSEIFLVIGVSKSSLNSLIWDGSEQITKQNISSYIDIPYHYLIENLKECILMMSKSVNKNSFAFNIDFMIYNNEVVIVEFSLRPGGNLLPYVVEHTFNINYCLTYLSILLDKPKVVHNINPIFNISPEKAINISIMQNQHSSKSHPRCVPSEFIHILKRRYLNWDTDRNLIAEIYGA